MRELDDLDERILGLIKHCTSASKLGIAEVSEGNLREAA